MSSFRLLKHSLIALFLSALSYAQDSGQCSTVPPQLRYNATSSVTFPGLSVSILGDVEDGIAVIRNETSFNWTLSSYIKSNAPNSSSTETNLWLDVGDSDPERLGLTMRACHAFVPLQTQAAHKNVTWSYETLEKSVQDTGDCRTMVSEECLDRLKLQYYNAANAERVDYTICSGVNTTVPWECASSGMVMPKSKPVPEFNSTLARHFPHSPSNLNPAIPNGTEQFVCDGRNFSSSFGTFVETQDYDLAINFPIMDIMIFFPTIRPIGTYRSDANRVEIACLVPGQVTEGSRAKASAQDVLSRYNSTGGNETAGAASLGGVDMWKLIAWVVGVGFVFAV